jgi:1-deoxy-D-xylulose-5-phosphate reductoisomerase
MNKGLELIEAYHLFPVDKDQLDIIVHPQSVIHSMVSYVDGSVLAQLGAPDMRIPISYAINYPKRENTPAKTLDLKEISRLDFFDTDEINFPATKIAREALHLGGSAPTILNAANEVAVYAFLEGKIKFLEIVQIVEQTLELMGSEKITSLEAVYATDAETRLKASELIKRVMI